MSPTSRVLQWLDAREPAAPGALAERMRAALDAIGAGASDAGAAAIETAGDAARAEWIARRLGDAALDRLRIVLAAPGARAAALDLLAADALLTYACEAAADAGPAVLAEVARAYGPERLASLLLDEDEVR